MTTAPHPDPAPPTGPGMDPDGPTDIWGPDDTGWLTQRQEFVDIRAVTRALGRAGGPVAASGPTYRAAKLLDLTVAQIPPQTTPLAVDGVVDGIQCSLVLRRREHRPITLFYVASGSCSGTKLTAIAERLSVICSHRDQEWVASRTPGLPITVLDEHHPSAVEVATIRVIDRARRAAERHIVETADPAGTLLVDGPVRHYNIPGTRVGVVKSLGEQLWIPASLLPTEFAHRSPIFRIPAESRTQADVHSCYLRIQPSTGNQPGNEGIIRLESTDPDLMDALCMYAVQHRQRPDSGDPRWAVHLSSVRATEDVLRVRSPWVFGT